MLCEGKTTNNGVRKCMDFKVDGSAGRGRPRKVLVGMCER